MTQIDMQNQTLRQQKYETAADPPGRYGPPRVGISTFRFLRLGSAMFGLISAGAIRFWHRPAARLDDPNRHAAQNAPNVPDKQTIRNRRNSTGSLRAPKGR